MDIVQEERVRAGDGGRTQSRPEDRSRLQTPASPKLRLRIGDSTAILVDVDCVAKDGLQCKAGVYWTACGSPAERTLAQIGKRHSFGAVEQNCCKARI